MCITAGQLFQASIQQPGFLFPSASTLNHPRMGELLNRASPNQNLQCWTNKQGGRVGVVVKGRLKLLKKSSVWVRASFPNGRATNSAKSHSFVPSDTIFKRPPSCPSISGQESLTPGLFTVKIIHKDHYIIGTLLIRFGWVRPSDIDIVDDSKGSSECCIHAWGHQPRWVDPIPRKTFKVTSTPHSSSSSPPPPQYSTPSWFFISSTSCQRNIKVTTKSSEGLELKCDFFLLKPMMFVTVSPLLCGWGTLLIRCWDHHHDLQQKSMIIIRTGWSRRMIWWLSVKVTSS